MTRRFVAALALGLPLLLLAMSGMIYAPLRTWLGPAGGWLQLALATPVVFGAGWPLVQRAWQSIVNRHPNMFTLIALGTAAAYFFSLAAVLFPGFFPLAAHASTGSRPCTSRRP